MDSNLSSRTELKIHFKYFFKCQMLKSKLLLISFLLSNIAITLWCTATCYFNAIIQYYNTLPTALDPLEIHHIQHTTLTVELHLVFSFIATHTQTYFNLVNNSEVFKWWWIFISAGSVQKPFNTSGDDGTKNPGKAPHSHINAWSPHTQPYVTFSFAI